LAVSALSRAKNVIIKILPEGAMAADIESVIVQDPEIHRGTRRSEELVYLSKYFLTTSKVRNSG
jgi:hypothetical protein